jgi:excisionase family DNA binding protein
MATETPAMNTPASERASVASPWLDVREAATRAKCGTRSIYNAVKTGRLQAAKLGGRRELRFLAEWIDTWLLETSTPVLVNTNGSRADPPAAR